MPLSRSTWYFLGAGELRLVRRGPGGRMRHFYVGDAALILVRSYFDAAGAAKLPTAIDRKRAGKPRRRDG